MYFIPHIFLNKMYSKIFHFKEKTNIEIIYFKNMFGKNYILKIIIIK